jgi:hypothetical protein
VSCPNINQATSSITSASDDRRLGEAIHHWRARLHADRITVLLDALNGVELTSQDRRIINWLATWEPDTVEIITGLFERVRAAGSSGGHQ